MFDDHEIRNNFDGGSQDPGFTTAIASWWRFLGARNPPPPRAAPRGALYYVFHYGDVGVFVLDVRSHRWKAPPGGGGGSMLGTAQLDCLQRFLLGTEAGSRKVRLRVVVSAVPFTLNAGEMSSSRRRQLALLNATIADMESDGWRQFPAERQQILRWMHEAQMPVLLLSGDMHWAGVFNAGGVVEVSASPIAQVAALAECVRGGVRARLHLKRPGPRTGWREWNCRCDDAYASRPCP
jgi:phosphodiesterase/alkaline phosphatase D-like protein